MDVVKDGRTVRSIPVSHEVIVETLGGDAGWDIPALLRQASREGLSLDARRGTLTFRRIGRRSAAGQLGQAVVRLAVLVEDKAEEIAQGAWRVVTHDAALP